MGYQESFIQFDNEDELKKAFLKYNSRDKENDLARVYCIDRVKKSVSPFSEGELVLVVGGERSEQRTEKCLKDGLGIDNVRNIVFIDTPHYWELSNGDLRTF